MAKHKEKSCHDAHLKNFTLCGASVRQKLFVKGKISTKIDVLFQRLKTCNLNFTLDNFIVVKCNNG